MFMGRVMVIPTPTAEPGGADSVLAAGVDREGYSTASIEWGKVRHTYKNGIGVIIDARNDLLAWILLELLMHSPIPMFINRFLAFHKSLF